MAGLNIVKSVEPIEFTFSSTAESFQLTKSQNGDYCVPFMSHSINANMSSYFNRYFTDVTITGSLMDPTVVFSKSNSTSANYMQAYIVEFNPEEINVISGDFSIGSGASSTTVTVSGIDTTKSMLLCYYNTTDGSRQAYHHFLRFHFSASDTITFTRGGTSGSITGHYFVVEDLGNNYSVDHVTFSNSDTYQQVRISNFHNQHNMMTFGSYYFNSTTEYPYYSVARFYNTYDSCVTCHRSNSGTGAIYGAIQRVKFNVPDSVRMVQKRTAYIGASNSSADWILSGNVNLDTSIVSNTSLLNTSALNSSSTDTQEEGFFKFKFTDSQTVNISRGQTGHDTAYSIEVIDWAGYTTRSGVEPSPKITALDEVNSMVRSIEEIDISSSINFLNVPLTKGQIVANCVPFITHKVNSNEQGRIMFDAYFFEPDILVLATIGSCTHEYKGYVVEFEPDQVRVQQGTFYCSATTNITTISGVDLSKAALRFYNQCFAGGQSFYYSTVRGRFSSNSELEFCCNTTGGNPHGHYYVFEALDDQFSVQSGLLNMTGTNASVSLGNNAMDHNSFCLFSYYFDSNTTGEYYYSVRGRLWDRRQFTIWRNSSSIGTIYSAYFVITLKNIVGKAFTQVYYANFYSTSTKSVSLQKNINMDTAITVIPNMFSVGQCNFSSSSYFYQMFTNCILTSSGTIELNRNSTDYDTYQTPQVIDFAGISMGYYEGLPRVKKSLVVSVEAIELDNTNEYQIISPTKGQNLNNCVPFFTSKSSSTGGYIYRCKPEVYFDDGFIHIKCELSGTRYVMLYIVEFNPDRVKVQQGHYEMIGTSSVTIDIEEVDLNKAFLVHNWHTNTSNQSAYIHLIRGYFNNNQQIIFDRGTTSNNVCGSYWVVESLDNGFTVESNNFSMSGTSATCTFTTTSDVLNRAFCVYSYRLDGSNASDTYYYAVRGYLYTATPNLNFNISRLSSGTGVVYAATFLIVFAEDEGLFAQHNGNVFFGSSIYSLEYNLPVKVNEDFSMVITPSAFCSTTINSSSTSVSEKTFFKCKLKDSGTKVECSMVNVSVEARGSYTVVQWPSADTYYFSGYITEEGLPVSREVYLFRRDTNDLMDSTTSSGDGYYELYTTYSGLHYIIAKDDPSDGDGKRYNLARLDYMTPEVIS